MLLSQLLQAGISKRLTYNIEGVGQITYRPLSEFEFDEISLHSFEAMSNVPTLKQLIKSDRAERTKIIEEMELQNFIEYQRIIKREKYVIVMYAIADFYEDIDPIEKFDSSLEQLKRMPGINNLVEEIKYASGRSIKVSEDLETFRGNTLRERRTITNDNISPEKESVLQSD